MKVNWKSFMDEMTKIAAAGNNAAAPASMKSGMGQNTMSGGKSTIGVQTAAPKMNISPKMNVAAKPQNYSIVHSEAPSAAFGATSSKVIPPPPVRT